MRTRKGESTPYDHTANYRPFQFQSLTGDQLTLLHEASLEIMARTGMRFYEPEALDLFKKAGASVTDGNLVRIPPHLVERALQTVPKDITIFDQTGRRAMSLGGYRSYFGVGSDCSYLYDLNTGQRRRAVLADVISGVRLVDALPNLDFVMSMFLPCDAPPERYERQQMAIMLQESTKPIVFVGMEASSTVYAVEMASAVAGGLDALQQYPFIVNYVNVTSAFRHNQDSVQRLLYAAERNLPTIYAPAKSRGTMAPITVPGALALGSAGELAGLVLSQLKREGSPFLRSKPGGDGMDMRTMVSLYAAPDGGPFGWDLAHYHRIPTFGAAGCSDAKVFDAQAAAEATLTLFDHLLNGANLIHDVGYLDCAMTGCLEFVTFCDEVIGWLRRYFRRLTIDRETLALDLIHQIGPDGHFVDTDHTLHHVREDWVPTLMDRFDYYRWEAKGATTLQERANRKVHALLDSHRAEPLPGDVIDALNAIVTRQP
ncbi:MAG: trimethylamine methyltransferase family protein [Anaerolineae bacterium]|jgi:trimethylamine--corrinoid protein Co-methyltransferase